LGTKEFKNSLLRSRKHPSVRFAMQTGFKDPIHPGTIPLRETQVGDPLPDPLPDLNKAIDPARSMAAQHFALNGTSPRTGTDSATLLQLTQTA
jgi:hypothetical protein